MSRRIPIVTALLCLLAAGCDRGHPRARRPASPRRGASRRTSWWSGSPGRARARGRACRPGSGVREAAAALRQNPRVDYAEPNYIATAIGAALLGLPNDPGSLDAVPSTAIGGWVTKQWNFLPWEGDGTRRFPTSNGGIDAVGAWRAPDGSRAAGRQGSQGRGPRHRDRLPGQGKSGSGAAPTSPRGSSPRDMTSSPTTGCRWTKTGTAPTSPARSARRRTTASP